MTNIEVISSISSRRARVGILEVREIEAPFSSFPNLSTDTILDSIYLMKLETV
jgi:hypothetical protein